MTCCRLAATRRRMTAMADGKRAAAAYSVLMVLALAGWASIGEGLGAEQRPSGEPTFNEEQAKRGRERYIQQCAACHAANLRGNETGVPALAGEDFLEKWRGTDVWEFANYTDTFMPPSDPGRLTDEELSEVVAFILRENDYAEGKDLLNLDLWGRSAPLVFSDPE